MNESGGGRALGDLGCNRDRAPGVSHSPMVDKGAGQKWAPGPAEWLTVKAGSQSGMNLGWIRSAGVSHSPMVVKGDGPEVGARSCCMVMGGGQGATIQGGLKALVFPTAQWWTRVLVKRWAPGPLYQQ
jgi:hypothetical protein